MSQNPYSTPDSPTFSIQQSVPPDLSNKLAGPAIGLIIVGCLNVLSALWNIALSVLTMLDLNPMNAWNRANFGNGPEPMDEMPEMMGAMMRFSEIMSGPVALVINLVALAVALGVVYAGIQMKAAQSYTFVMTFAVLSMIPCVSGCYVVAIPIGIWAIVVLADPNVRAAFANR